MKSIRVDLPQELNDIKVYIFSDWHIGDKFCDTRIIAEQIEQIKNEPNAYVICNGDLMNNATKTSVSDCYAEELTPMEQLETFINFLRPIKDKIICLTAGNHENRTFKSDGIDLTQLAARELGIEERYGREGILVFLRVGIDKSHSTPDHPRQQSYRIYCTHGSGGGRKEGGKAIRLAELANIVNADVYVHSHTHMPMVMRNATFETDSQNSRVKEVDRLFVNSSANLSYGGYGQQYSYKPNSRRSPVICLSGTAHFATAEL